MKTKKLITIGLSAALVVTAMAAFAACGETDNGKDANKISVTYYDGRTELKTEKVEKGGKATTWTPEKEGYEFKGWYEESSLEKEFDFAKALQEDTNVYSKWLSTAFTADTTVYYAVGAGSGDMKDSNWDQTTAIEKLTFAKDATVTNKNVFTLQIKLYAGDQFQIVHDGDWAGQMGIGYVVGNAQTADAAEADANYWAVKNAAGEIVFQTSKGFGDSAGGWNIGVAPGKDGVYKFKLTTYPGQSSNNTIEWELVEAIEPLATTHEMYIIGGMNNWDSNHPENLIAMKNDKGVWTGYFTTEAEVEFKVFNSIGSGWIGGDDGGNFKATEAGTYCLSYNQETNKATFEKCEYYLVGTFLDSEGGAVNFSVKVGVTPKLEKQADGSYTVTFTAVNAAADNNYKWITDQNKPGVFAMKVVFGSSLGIKDWYAAEGGDNWYLAAGSHTVTLTITGETVTVTVA